MLNELTILNGSPKAVKGSFYCQNNILTTLDGSPNHIGNIFDCSRNKLTDLTGSPNYINDFYCYNNQLTALFGMPKIINRLLGLNNNPNLCDISDIWDSDIKGEIYLDLNPGMAILPLIKFKIYINNNDKFCEIHKRHRGYSKQNIIDFQYDLIEHGYEDNAKWEL